MGIYMYTYILLMCTYMYCLNFFISGRHGRSMPIDPAGGRAAASSLPWGLRAAARNTFSCSSRRRISAISAFTWSVSPDTARVSSLTSLMSAFPELCRGPLVLLLLV